MKRDVPKPLRCAIYTRVSTEHGLEQEFNSLDNQREAAEAYGIGIKHLAELPASWSEQHAALGF